MKRIYLNLPKKIIRTQLHKDFSIFSMPYKVTFISTYKCNSRCKTCNVWKIYQENPKKYREELSKEETIKIINSMKDDIIWLNFTGGEPILKKNLAETIREAYDLCRNLSIINIPTNGLLPKKELEFFDKISKHCKKTAISATLSLDGFEEIHDDIRGIKGAFKKVIESYKKLKTLEKKYKNFSVSFQMTISEMNIHQAEKLFRFIQTKSRYPVVNFAIESEVFHNKGLKVDIRKKDINEIKRIINKINKNFKIRNPNNYFAKRYLTHTKYFLKKEKAPIRCFASYSTITIDPYGNVWPCPHICKPIANVRQNNYNMKKILKSNEAKKVRKEITNCRMCWQSCEAYPSMIQL